MRFLMFIFTICFSQAAFACGEQDLTKGVSFESLGLQGNCYDVRVLFLKEALSREHWLWADPFVKLKTYKDDQVIISVPLEVWPDKKNTLKTNFCLAKDLIHETIMTITYEERSTKAPSQDGLVPVSFCNHAVVIDDFKKIINEENDK